MTHTEVSEPRRAYLAGPMRGLPQFNFPAFDHAAARLRSEGWVIFNPAERDREEGFNPENGDGLRTHEHYMRHDIAAILKCDYIILLPGWKNSVGARQEYQVGKMIGCKFLTYPELQPLEDEPVLAEAARITSAERQKTYGHPADNMKHIARLWRAHLECKYDLEVPIEAADVPWMMIQVKQSRDFCNPIRDNAVDTAGYSRVLSQVRGYEA